MQFVGSFALSDFPDDTWPTLLFNVSCTGEEITILDCAHTLEQESCGANEKASVICQSMYADTSANSYSGTPE